MAIKKYKGEDNRLITAELFFRQLVSIKRIEDKVQVMRAISTFDELVEELRTSFKTLQRVCSQIMDSEKLILVLEMVLKVGNLMNAGSVNGGVEAFKVRKLWCCFVTTFFIFCLSIVSHFYFGSQLQRAV